MFGRQWKKDFFQEKLPDNSSAEDLESIFDQIVEKILPEVWEFLSLSQTIYLFNHIFFWPMT